MTCLPCGCRHCGCACAEHSPSRRAERCAEHSAEPIFLAIAREASALAALGLFIACVATWCSILGH